MASRNFTIVLRGYDRAEVDTYLDAVEAGTPATTPAGFKVSLRGYDRRQVDQYLEQLTGSS
jgi:DivIVA domain-containing protein